MKLNLISHVDDHFSSFFFNSFFAAYRLINSFEPNDASKMKNRFKVISAICQMRCVWHWLSSWNNQTNENVKEKWLKAFLSEKSLLNWTVGFFHSNTINIHLIFAQNYWESSNCFTYIWACTIDIHSKSTHITHYTMIAHLFRFQIFPK